MTCRKYYTEEDLQLFYYYNDEPKDVKTKNYLDKIYIEGMMYKIIFLISGDRIFEIGNERFTVSDGAVAIESPLKRIGFERISNRTNCYLQIMIHPKVFENIAGDNDFLRVFDKTTDRNKIFFPAEFKTQTCFNLLNSLFDVLDMRLGRVHLLPKIFSIISELDMQFDRTSDSFNGADNYNVNIIGYIEKHFTEKLTIEKLCNKFFISRTTVNTIVKNYTGITFLKYLNSLRAKEANRLIKDTLYPLKSIYSLCGFSDYSTFFRTYKKVYGVSPNDDISKNRPYNQSWGNPKNRMKHKQKNNKQEDLT